MDIHLTSHCLLLAFSDLPVMVTMAGIWRRWYGTGFQKRRLLRISHNSWSPGSFLLTELLAKKVKIGFYMASSHPEFKQYFNMIDLCYDVWHLTSIQCSTRIHLWRSPGKAGQTTPIIGIRYDIQKWLGRRRDHPDCQHRSSCHPDQGWGNSQQ